MQKVQVWLQAHSYRVLMLLLGGGFLMLLVELIITDHLDGIQLVAVAATIIGAGLIAAAFFLREGARPIIAVLLLLLSVTGLLGAYEHYESTGEEAAVRPALVQANQPIGFHLEEEEEKDAQAGERDEADAVPPPLAPLSLAGLSLMGAVVILGVPEERSA